ncbi:hypothetical protein ES703_78293 [subsurface metagenome]
MRFAGSGKSRAVILIGSFAFKVARFGLGYVLRRTVAILFLGQTGDKIVEWRRKRNLSLCASRSRGGAGPAPIEDHLLVLRADQPPWFADAAGV